MWLHTFAFLFLCSFLQMAISECPRLCECKWKSGKESVICLNANLSVVPPNLEAGTQVLDLTGNNLSIIKHEEFSSAGLVNLQKVYISKCRLKNLERYAFRNLINLVELDLSYNILTAVPSHTFDSIPELRELKLNGNPIQKITNDAFRNIPQLIRLEMTDCKINTIESRAFIGLSQSLEWLKLDKNKLSQVTASSFTILQSLHGLELAGNPWNCSCFLRPLREWMLRQNVPFGVPPVCQYPKRLYGKPWDKLDLDEFACVPEIFAYDGKAHGIEGRNVTMTCRIAGIPEPNVRWLLKNKVIANLSTSPFSNGKKLYIVHLQNNSSYLTIFSADLQDAGTYVCSAENKAGKAEASVTLAVSRKPPEVGFNNKILVASVLTGIGFVLISCLIGVCVCSVRKRQMIKWRRGRTDCRDDNYEKIEMNHHKVSSNACGGANTSASDRGDNEIALVMGNRKNGEYRVVPGADTDQEVDEEDEGENSGQRNGKSWTTNESSTLDKKWNSPEHLLDPDDLHIPRRTIQEVRDNIKKTFNSTSGTYKQQYQPTSSLMNPTPLIRGQIITTTPSTSTYATTCNRELSGMEDNNEKKFPDLIENSKFKNSTASIRAHSEGGSVNDINELFCTLPRKKPSFNHNSARYRSTDSQSPLLPDSRYGSSGGESSSSQETNLRRFSNDISKYTNLNRNRVNKISNSFLNLTREESLPSSAMNDLNTPSTTTTTTPLLLDVTSLESRFKKESSYTPAILSPPPSSSTTSITPNANTYDYHAAQLERFLEEYRTLQKQLTKMKETCDNLCQERNQYLPTNISPSSSSTCDDTSTSKPLNLISSPNSNHSLKDSIDFRNFENELTKYLLSQSKSQHKNLNSSVFHN